MSQHQHASSARPFSEYRNTTLWTAIERILKELGASGELSINTSPEYVIGYLCRELEAKKLVLPGSER
jgi:hypothetical protein